MIAASRKARRKSHLLRPFLWIRYQLDETSSCAERNFGDRREQTDFLASTYRHSGQRGPMGGRTYAELPNIIVHLQSSSVVSSSIYRRQSYWDAIQQIVEQHRLAMKY
jgi:hypothetical protein